MQEDPKMAAVLDELAEVAARRGAPDLSHLGSPEAARRWVRKLCGVREDSTEEVMEGQADLPFVPADK